MQANVRDLWCWELHEEEAERIGWYVIMNWIRSIVLFYIRIQK